MSLVTHLLAWEVAGKVAPASFSFSAAWLQSRVKYREIIPNLLVRKKLRPGVFKYARLSGTWVQVCSKCSKVEVKECNSSLHLSLWLLLRLSFNFRNPSHIRRVEMRPRHRGDVFLHQVFSSSDCFFFSFVNEVWGMRFSASWHHCNVCQKIDWEL